MAATDKIPKAAPEDLPEISSALSRAFFDDPCPPQGRRLVMRLLAVTAGPLRGRSTEPESADIAAEVARLPW
jgi:hypothetical protein